MCDYSLANLPNRLAAEGEELVVYRFPSGSMGLASPTEVSRVADQPLCSSQAWWDALKSFFGPPETDPVPAVCVPPGARLLLQDIPQNLQRQFGVGANEEVTFVQQSAEAFRYRDAIRFDNGREILLQELCYGQRVHVLCLDWSDFHGEEPHRDRHMSRVRGEGN